MSDSFLRCRMLLGDEAMEKLKKARVAVFGVGGVGGYVAEALIRSGIGSIDVFDRDTVSSTNLNRQIIALKSTIGRAKVDVIKERALEINPNIKINTHNTFYMPDNADDYDLSEYTYIIDAVDTVTAKLELAVRAERAGVMIISSMGTAGKMDITKLEVDDIYKTKMCPLARVMRKELKERGIKSLKVVYSTEEAKSEMIDYNPETKKSVPGSLMFVPAAAGLIIAGEVVKDIIAMPA